MSATCACMRVSCVAGGRPCARHVNKNKRRSPPRWTRSRRSAVKRKASTKRRSEHVLEGLDSPRFSVDLRLPSSVVLVAKSRLVPEKSAPVYVPFLVSWWSIARFLAQYLALTDQKYGRLISIVSSEIMLNKIYVYVCDRISLK